MAGRDEETFVECAVCKAKREQRRIPKRKCTCQSGWTVGRNTSSADQQRYAERQSRELERALLGTSFIDCKCSVCNSWSNDAFGIAMESLGAAQEGMQLACEEGNMQRLRSLFDEIREDLPCPKEREWVLLLRLTMAAACEFGNIDAVRFLLECGMSLEDGCHFYDPPLSWRVMEYPWQHEAPDNLREMGYEMGDLDWNCAVDWVTGRHAC